MARQCFICNNTSLPFFLKQILISENEELIFKNGTAKNTY